MPLCCESKAIMSEEFRIGCPDWSVHVEKILSWLITKILVEETEIWVPGLEPVS